MLLKSIQIKHFKSLDDVSLSFSDPITLLVGSNAVGKSNVVDALRFLTDAVVDDLDHAVSSRGGMVHLRQVSKTRPYDLEMNFDFGRTIDSNARLQARYAFSIRSEKSGGNFAVTQERAHWFDVDADPQTPLCYGYERDNFGNVKFTGQDGQERLGPDELALRSSRLLNDSAVRSIADFVHNWRYSAPQPNVLRQPAPPDTDKVLAEDGKNWASVIKALKRSPRGRSALDRVFEAMRVVVPNFQDVTVSTVGNYLVPRFRFAQGQSDTVEFDPVQLSDGTLRIFGILLALYQVPAPSLLVVEEPEQTVHPGVLGVMADAFKEASEQTQIVITTHSPHLIDHFLPEQVRVVSLINGLTRVAPIRNTQMAAVKSRLMSMQDFMLAEGLQQELEL